MAGVLLSENTLRREQRLQLMQFTLVVRAALWPALTQERALVRSGTSVEHTTPIKTPINAVYCYQG